MNFLLLFKKYACSLEVLVLKKCSRMICCFTSLTISRYRSSRLFPCLIRFRLLSADMQSEKQDASRSENIASEKGTLLMMSLFAVYHIDSTSEASCRSWVFFLDFDLIVNSLERSKPSTLSLVIGPSKVYPINLSPSSSPPTSPMKSRKLYIDLWKFFVFWCALNKQKR